MLKAILFLLPMIEIGVTDYHLHVAVGEKRALGVTMGPHFLSFDRNNDIAAQIISPPVGYQAPISDFTFLWNTRTGLDYLNIPGHRAARDSYIDDIAVLVEVDNYTSSTPELRWVDSAPKSDKVPVGGKKVA